MECHSPKCAGTMKIVVGVLILLAAFVWPKLSGIDNWVAFLGALMVLFGVMKFFHPSCGSGECCLPDKPASKKRK
ncbi:hypothetical protein HOC13_03940 [Candidatus Woesearchaeota archaeon]|nr:hypothetical protein [Candidatus Woesearchaeota archaeon]